MRRCTRMRESTRLTKHNVHTFLRRFAKQIPLDELELIPTGQFSDSFTFYYGNDKILKVNKVNTRPALLKEAKLAEYLYTQKLPVTFAKPLFVHAKGFYAVFSRIDYRRLTPETVGELEPDELESFTQSLGTFLSFLHGHKFPDNVLDHIPRPSEDLTAENRQARRRIEFIKEHGPEVDTTRFEENLDRLQGSLDQVWAVTHQDFTSSNVLLGRGNSERLAIIDFTDAEILDPSVDLAYFAEDLAGEGIQPGPIIESMLKHYETDDELIEKKMEFRLLVREITFAFWRVRDSVRRSEAKPN